MLNGKVAVVTGGAGGVGRAGPWERADGWRVGDAATTTSRLVRADGEVVVIRRWGLPEAGTLAVGDGAELAAAAAELDGDLVVRLCGESRRYKVALAKGNLWLSLEGRTWTLSELAPGAARDGGRGHGAGPVTSPMPGVVTEVLVAVGDLVEAGQLLVGVEAMKMEHALVAGAAGVVTEVLVAAGDKVAVNEPLVVLDTVVSPSNVSALGDARTREDEEVP